MSRTISRFQDSVDQTDTMVNIGDTVNGKKITEIWCSSVGTPIFVVDGSHYSWKDFLNLLPDGLPPATTEYVTEEEFNMSEEEYRTVTSGL